MNHDVARAAGETPAGPAVGLDLHRLLGRAPLPIDEAALAGSLAGRRVLVTGAGGSIGSHLARKLKGWGVGELALVDNHENSLYELQVALGTGGPLHYRLADVRRADSVRRLLLHHRPEVVFHLAAYKHVPLGEENPGEVFVANVLGTLNLLQAAAEAGVASLAYPSTDKAVYPPSVYGASKRAVELLLRAFTRADGRPRCVVLRLVNAVGAQGGVIRLFARQIAAGLPLTMTHEGMTRYWISMEEAALLVAQAACAAPGIETIAPDVGPAIRLTAVARRLHELLRPDAPFEVTVTGMRPGERLAEILVRDDERLAPCPHPGVLAVRDLAESRPSWSEMLAAVARLERHLAEGDEEGLRADLFALASA